MKFAHMPEEPPPPPPKKSTPKMKTGNFTCTFMLLLMMPHLLRLVRLLLQ